MSDLEIDLQQLETMMVQMRVVRTEFEGAEEFSQTVADLVGHDGLAGVVRDFGSKWNLRRAELLEELDYIASATETIHDTMQELDQELSTVIANYRPFTAGGGGGGGGGGGR